jgi:hypothetical protein
VGVEARGDPRRAAARQARRLRGTVVQVEPIKPTLKAPVSERVKLKFDEPLSNFAFNFY